MKPIIVYASESGSTEVVANRISFDLDCDKLKIEPVEDYSNYLFAAAKIGFSKLTGKKSHYANLLPDLSGYDVILFGFPIWYSAPPEYALEFIKNCNLKGKVIVPFCTSGASPITVALDKIRAACPESKVLYPYTSSVASGDNYSDWMKIISFMCDESAN